MTVKEKALSAGCVRTCLANLFSVCVIGVLLCLLTHLLCVASLLSDSTNSHEEDWHVFLRCCLTVPAAMTRSITYLACFFPLLSDSTSSYDEEYYVFGVCCVIVV